MVWIRTRLPNGYSAPQAQVPTLFIIPVVYLYMDKLSS